MSIINNYNTNKPKKSRTFFYLIILQVTSLLLIGLYLLHQRIESTKKLNIVKDSQQILLETNNHQYVIRQIFREQNKIPYNYENSSSLVYYFDITNISSVNGVFALGKNQITFTGNIKPGFETAVYLSKETRDFNFTRLIDNGIYLGTINDFNSFSFSLKNINISDYPTLVIGYPKTQSPLMIYNYQGVKHSSFME